MGRSWKYIDPSRFENNMTALHQSPSLVEQYINKIWYQKKTIIWHICVILNALFSFAPLLCMSVRPSRCLSPSRRLHSALLPFMKAAVSIVEIKAWQLIQLYVPWTTHSHTHAGAHTHAHWNRCTNMLLNMRENWSAYIKWTHAMQIKYLDRYTDAKNADKYTQTDTHAWWSSLNTTNVNNTQYNCLIATPLNLHGCLWN